MNTLRNFLLIGMVVLVSWADEFPCYYEDLPVRQSIFEQSEDFSIQSFRNYCDELPIDNIEAFELGGDPLKPEIVIASFSRRCVAVLFDTDFDEFSELFLVPDGTGVSKELTDPPREYTNRETPTDILSPLKPHQDPSFRYCLDDVTRMIIIDFSLQEISGREIGAGMAVGDLDHSALLTNLGSELILGDPSEENDKGMVYILPDFYQTALPYLGQLVNVTLLKAVSILGRQEGERFGAQLRCGRFDDDSAEDLFVGSPTYRKWVNCSTPDPGYEPFYHIETEESAYFDNDGFTGLPYYFTNNALNDYGANVLLMKRCERYSNNPDYREVAGRIHVFYGSELEQPWINNWGEYSVKVLASEPDDYAIVSGGVTFHQFGVNDYGFCEIDSSIVGTLFDVGDMNGDGQDDLLIPSIHTRVKMGEVLGNTGEGATASLKVYEFGQSETLYSELAATVIYNWPEVEVGSEYPRLLESHRLGEFYTRYLAALDETRQALHSTIVSTTIEENGTITTIVETELAPPRMDLVEIMPRLPQRKLEDQHAIVFKTKIGQNGVYLSSLDMGCFTATKEASEPDQQTKDDAKDLRDGFLSQDYAQTEWGLPEPSGQNGDMDQIYDELEAIRENLPAAAWQHRDIYQDVIVTVQNPFETTTTSYVLVGGDDFIDECTPLYGPTHTVVSVGDVNTDGLEDLLLLYQGWEDGPDESHAKIIYGRTDWSSFKGQLSDVITKGIYRRFDFDDPDLIKQVLQAKVVKYPFEDQGTKFLLAWDSAEEGSQAQNLLQLWNDVFQPDLRIHRVRPDGNRFRFCNIGPDTLRLSYVEMGELGRDLSAVDGISMGHPVWTLSDFNDESLVDWVAQFPRIFAPQDFIEFEFDTTLLALPTHGAFNRHFVYKSNDPFEPDREIHAIKTRWEADVHLEEDQQHLVLPTPQDVQVPNEAVISVGFGQDNEIHIANQPMPANAMEFRLDELVWVDNTIQFQMENRGNIPLVVDSLALRNLYPVLGTYDHSRMHVGRIDKYFRIYVNGGEMAYAGRRAAKDVSGPNGLVEYFEDVWIWDEALEPVAGFGGDALVSIHFEPVDFMTIDLESVRLVTNDPGDDLDFIAAEFVDESEDVISGVPDWRALAPGLFVNSSEFEQRGEPHTQMKQPDSDVSCDIYLGDIRVVDADSADAPWSTNDWLPYIGDANAGDRVLHFGNVGNTELACKDLRLLEIRNPADTDWLAFEIPVASSISPIPAGADRSIALNFEPWDVGPFETLLYIPGDGDLANRLLASADPHITIAPNRTYQERDMVLRLHGNGYAPDVDLENSNFDFGIIPYVPNATNQLAMQGKVANKGNLNLNIDSIEEGLSLETERIFTLNLVNMTLPLEVWPGRPENVEITANLSAIQDVNELPKTFTQVFRFYGNDPTPGEGVFEIEAKATVVANWVRVSARNLYFGTALRGANDRDVIVSLENMCFADEFSSLVYDVDASNLGLDFGVWKLVSGAWVAIGTQLTLERGEETYLKFKMNTDQSGSQPQELSGSLTLTANPSDPTMISPVITFTLAGSVDSEAKNLAESVTYFDESRLLIESKISNAAGLPVQTLVSDGEDAVITQTLYDTYGRPVAETLPVEQEFQGSFYDPLLEINAQSGAVSVRDPNAFAATRSVFGNTAMPFTETRYEANPFNRVRETLTPADENGNRISDKRTYGIGESCSVAEPDMARWTRTTRDKVDSSGNPTGADLTIFETFEDLEGHVTKNSVIDAPTGTPTSERVDTHFRYDDLGRKTAILPPLAGEDPESSYATKLFYNALGQVVRKIVPDSDGEFKYAYDATGRLRFFADPNIQVALDIDGREHFYYYNYDSFGNLIEVGVGRADRFPDIAKGPFHGDSLIAQYVYGERPFNAENTAGRLSTQRYNFRRIPIFELEEGPGGVPVPEAVCARDTLVYDASFFSYRFDGNLDWILHKYHDLTYRDPEKAKHEAQPGVTNDPDMWDLNYFMYHPVYYKVRYFYDRAGHITADNGLTTYGQQFTAMVPDEADPERELVQTDLYLHQTHRRRYGYDSWGRLTDVREFAFSEDHALNLAEYAWTFNGLLAEERLGGSLAGGNPPAVYSQVRGYSYDALGRLSAMNEGFLGNDGSTADRLYAFALTYDKRGNVMAETRNLATLDGTHRQRAMTYDYDYLGRLTTATAGLGGYDGEAYSYVYDDNGNITSQERSTDVGMEALTYAFQPGNNRIASIARSVNGVADPSPYAMTYDANGNLTHDDLPRWGTEATIEEIVYDHHNLPRSMTMALGDGKSGRIEYRYDSEGRQISRENWKEDPAGDEIADTRENEFQFCDGQGRLDARLSVPGVALGLDWVHLHQHKGDDQGTPVTWHREDITGALPGTLVRHWQNYGVSGQLSQSRLDYTWGDFTSLEVLQPELFLSDHLGSPRLRLQGDHGGLGEVNYSATNPMDYEPFGLELPRSATAKTTPEGYTGKPLDATFGLNAMNYGARFYDPRLGRWWQRDPLTESMPNVTPYNYSHNDPINRLDSDGKADFGTANNLISHANPVLEDSKLFQGGPGPWNNSHDKKATWCNVGAASILLSGGDKSLSIGGKPTGINAVAMGNVMRAKGSGYVETTPENAQQLAQDGVTAIAWQAPRPGGIHGHIAVVSPDPSASGKIQVFNVGVGISAVAPYGDKFNKNRQVHFYARFQDIQRKLPEVSPQPLPASEVAR